MTEETKIRVMIVDDHASMRVPLRSLLDDCEDLEVVIDVERGEEALRAVQDHAPDVILLDLVLETSQIDGVEVIKKLRDISPSTQVVVLTAYSDESTVFSALRAGAIGYMLKSCWPNEVIEAIRDAAKGKHHMADAVMKKIMARVQSENTIPESTNVESLFTPREREILPLLAKGLSNQQIAEQLFIGRTTVKTHVSNILRKLDLSDRHNVAIKLAQQNTHRVA